jgi:flavin reductase (DIM6/NTAB) family NADH-FMN oxidoreductase RutF
MENQEMLGKALEKIGYGLYVITCHDGSKDTGCIVNAVAQVATDRIAVSINKQNYTHAVVKHTGELVLNCLTESCPFGIIQNFGFQSGRTVDKCKNFSMTKMKNGVSRLDFCVNAALALHVEQYVDLESHGLFICSVTEVAVLNQEPSMTYAYYHTHVKPKPQPPKSKGGWICKICGYIYEGEELPPDFICPICKHGAADFERINA